MHNGGRTLSNSNHFARQLMEGERRGDARSEGKQFLNIYNIKVREFLRD
jgi:hypothetical protein